jgi:hypothetical protein
METSLAAQLEVVLTSLEVAKDDAEKMLQVARQQRLSFGLDFSFIDVDIELLIQRLEHVKTRVERQQE